jgi:hypothetical protein
MSDWAVSELDEQVHVWPLDDTCSHDLSPMCWCEPQEDEGVWVHNSMDGRERPKPS